jgi:hypothetical protein
VISLSHGYLEDFRETGSKEAIMFDRAVLSLGEVEAEWFKSSKELEYQGALIDKPVGFETNYHLIARNGVTCSGDESSYVVLLELWKDSFEEGGYNYLEWFMKLKRWSLGWDSFILHKDWISGAEKL